VISSLEFATAEEEEATAVEETASVFAGFADEKPKKERKSPPFWEKGLFGLPAEHVSELSEHGSFSVDV